jgi:hypothetical protein
VFNATNMLGKDKSALEMIKVQVTDGALGLTGPGRRPRPPARLRLPELPVGVAFRSATASLAGWLASLPRRLGARLFAMNDTEAGWRGWEITELRCGLARSYRDPRFDLLRALHALRALDRQTTDALDWPVADPPTIVRPVDGWDDVHGWPWDGEGRGGRCHG